MTALVLGDELMNCLHFLLYNFFFYIKEKDQQVVTQEVGMEVRKRVPGWGRAKSRAGHAEDD